MDYEPGGDPSVWMGPRDVDRVPIGGPLSPIRHCDLARREHTLAHMSFSAVGGGVEMFPNRLKAI